MQSNEDRGWVKPLGDAPDAAQMNPISPQQPTKRSILFGGLILSTLIIVALVSVFAWRGLRGDPLGSARSVPAGMDYVVSFDALALSDSERLQSFVDAFTTPAFTAGLIDESPDDLVTAVDRAMTEETGFSLTDDILPWIGRSVSIAGTIPEIRDPFMEPSDIDISALLSADVRDELAAQAFVAKLRRQLEEDGLVVEPMTIGALSGYRLGEPGDDLNGALVLTADALLVGLYDDVVAGVNARDSGQSMADDARYLEAMTHLPADQMMTFYMSDRALDNMAALGTGGLYGIEEQEPIQSFAASSFGGSIGLVDEGLLVTYVTVGKEALPALVTPDQQVLATLPAETLGFVSIAGGEGTVEPFDSSVFDQLGIPAESIEADFGVDIVAILESLSGNFTAAATETREGAIARETDAPIGVVAAIGLTDSAPLADAIAAMTELLGEEGVDVVSNGGPSIVVKGDQEFFSYSLEEELLVIGTGSGLVGEVASGQDSGVVDSDLYRRLDGVVTGEGLIVYADIGRIVRLVPLTSDESSVLAPLRGFGVGVSIDGTVGVVESLLLVDY